MGGAAGVDTGGRYREDGGMNLEDVFPGDYLAFDLETTGFSPTKNDIIQIGIVEVVEGTAACEGESYLMNPSYPDFFRVPKEITELTGISSMDVSVKGMDPRTLIPMISDRLCHSPIVTHNGIAFDRRLFNEACGEYDAMRPWNGYWLDTAVIYKAMKLAMLPMLGVYDTMVEFAVEVRRPIRG